MHRNHWSCALACGLLVGGLALDVRGDEGDGKSTVDPSGTYTWERTRRNSDEKIKSTLTLQVDGKRVTGTLAGGRGEPVKIENGKLEGDTISFDYTRARGDRVFRIRYQGKLTATGIKGTIAFGNSDRTREWEARKVAGPADVLGLWKFKLERPDREPIETSMRITREGGELKGLYTHPRGESQAKSIKVDGDVLSFELSGELDNGGEYHVVYRGKVSGDVYKGRLEYRFGDRDGTMDFVGHREPKKAAQVEIAGTWIFAVPGRDGETRERKIVITRDGEKLKAVYSGQRGEREAKAVELKGDTLTLDFSRESDRGSFVAIYKGKVSGDSIKGTLTFKFGDREETTREFSGRREAAEKKKVSL